MTGDGRRSLSYRQLVHDAARVAGGLRASGIEVGDRVALRYPDGIDWVVAFWGCLFARAVVVPVNTRMVEAEVAQILDRAGCRRDLGPGTALPDGPPLTDRSAAAGDVAAIFWTSGTTGQPKGVPTTHAAYMSNSETMDRCLGLGSRGQDLRTLISVPLFHVTGCNAQLLAVLHLAGTAVIMPTLDLTVLTDTLARERISFLVTVPAVYRLLLRHPGFAGADPGTRGGLRFVGYGGAPITPSLVHELREAFPGAQVFNGFGTTETAAIISVLPHADALDHADSVGYPAPVVDLAVDVDDTWPDSRTPRGELLVRGPNVLRHYWGTDRSRDPSFDGEWYRTGDVVTVDHAGRISIIDRVKDIINRGGENVSSVEVEEALLSAPGVRDAAVVSAPDEVMGEKVGAVLVGDDLDIDAVIAHVATRIADFKVPQYVVLSHDPLPRNPSGKLLKSALRSSVTWGGALR